MRRSVTLDPESLDRLVRAFERGDRDRAMLKSLVKHVLAVLSERAPGRSVEVRVPPFAVVQVIEGARHVRGTPPAVVETDAVTLIELARGLLAWNEAVATGRVTASGERADLTPHLPLI